MDAPKCRLCGERHWQSEPHIWPKGAGLLQKVEIANRQPVAEFPEPVRDAASVSHMANTYQYRDPDKRRAYMRDLMRRKRADSKTAR